MNELDELYFKDSFSKIGDKINLTINELSASCIVSNNDSFHLDSEGNLTVKTIHALETGSTEIDYTSILNRVYPIGSIYTSVNENNPTILFGGSWQEFGSGRTLVGLNNEAEFNALEKTGGSKAIQSHNHNVNATLSGGSHIHRGRYRAMASGNLFALRRISNDDSYDGDAEQINYPGGEHTHSLNTNTSSSGSGNSGNLQPYIVVHFWKRIS